MPVIGLTEIGLIDSGLVATLERSPGRHGQHDPAAVQPAAGAAASAAATGSHALLLCDLDQLAAHNAHQRLDRGDLLGRLGGDELLVVLQDVGSLDVAIEVAEKIRRAVHEPIAGSGSGERALIPSLSIGVTLLADQEELDSALARADASTFAAKANGGNQVFVMPAGPGVGLQLRGRAQPHQAGAAEAEVDRRWRRLNPAEGRHTAAATAGGGTELGWQGAGQGQLQQQHSDRRGPGGAARCRNPPQPGPCRARAQWEGVGHRHHLGDGPGKRQRNAARRRSNGPATDH